MIEFGDKEDDGGGARGGWNSAMRKMMEVEEDNRIR